MLHHQVEVKAAVIDRDYTGNIKVILYNHSALPYTVIKGAKIAQMVTYYVNQSNPTITHTLQDTLCGSGGFGSTSDYEHAPHTLLDTSKSATTVQHTQQGSGTFHDTQQRAGPDDYIQQHLATTKEPSTDPSGDTPAHLVPIHTIWQVHQITEHILQTDGMEPYNVWMSTDPFHYRLKINIDLQGNHPTVGLIVKQCPNTDQVQLTNMAPGTPGVRLPEWRSTLRRSILLAINGHAINHPDDVSRVIAEVRAQGATHGVFEFATATGLTHHPTEGSLHLYYDQLNIIASHLQQYHPMATINTSDRAVIHTATGPPLPDEELG